MTVTTHPCPTLLPDETLEALADWADKHDLSLGATAELNKILDRTSLNNGVREKVKKAIEAAIDGIDLNHRRGDLTGSQGQKYEVPWKEMTELVSCLALLAGDEQ